MNKSNNYRRTGRGIKLKLTAVLLALAVSGWAFPSPDIYAATYYPKTVIVPMSYFKGKHPAVNTLKFRIGTTYSEGVEYDSYRTHSVMIVSRSIGSYDNGQDSTYGNTGWDTDTVYWLLDSDNPYQGKGSNYEFHVIGTLENSTLQSTNLYKSAASTPSGTKSYVNSTMLRNHWNVKYFGKSTAAPKLPSMSQEECIAAGKKEGIKYRFFDYTGPAHSFTSNTATCTTAGMKKCSCGYSESTPALGHSWDGGRLTSQATPYSNGVITYICQRDGTHRRTETTPKKHFQIFSGVNRIEKICLGNSLIMDSASGTSKLVR